MCRAPGLQKVTPVILVQRIEPILPFWTRLGLEAVTQVPEGEGTGARIGFVILSAPGIELMYQTVTSMANDLVKSAGDINSIKLTPPQALLYVDVASISAIEKLLGAAGQIIPQRTTFYGSTEIGYLDPAGNVIVFSQQTGAQ